MRRFRDSKLSVYNVCFANTGGDNMLEIGGKWDGQHYVLNGKTITDAFFFDGNYTYYLQADGHLLGYYQ